MSREISQKLHMDFGVIRSICHVMDEQELRGQFTDIGSIMEDASVIALVWMFPVSTNGTDLML